MGQRIAINTAAGIASIKQVTRLSVLNTSAHSTWDQPGGYRDAYGLTAPAAQRGPPPAEVQPIAIITE